MKNVCDSCKYAKEKGRARYCVKYGIIIYKERVYCISYEGEQIQGQEDGDRWNYIRQREGSEEVGRIEAFGESGRNPEAKKADTIYSDSIPEG